MSLGRAEAETGVRASFVGPRVSTVPHASPAGTGRRGGAGRAPVQPPLIPASRPSPQPDRRSPRLYERVHRDHLALAALVCLSWGALVYDGTLSDTALIDVVAGLALAALALRARALGPPAGRATWVLAASACAAAAFRYTGLFARWPVLWLVLIITAAATVVALARRRWVLFGAALAGGGAVITLTAVGWQWGRAAIDVFRLLQTGTAALLHGHNPYTPTELGTLQTAPHVFVQQPIHFDYLPGAILLAAPARALGDVRVASVIAFLVLSVCAVRMAASSANGASRTYRVLALCLASPLTVAMVYNSWLDVYSVAGFAGWVALRHSHRRWAIVCLVVAMTVKPTILIALVPFLLWSRRARLETAVALLAAALVILPFALITGPVSFYHDVAGVYGQLGFRYDGLTLSAWWFELTGSLIPVALSLAVGCVVTLFALGRRPVDLADPLIAGAVISTAGFLLAKQAFLNYYFIPVWLLILALAARGLPLDPEADVTLPAPLLAATPRKLTRRLISGPGWPVT